VPLDSNLVIEQSYITSRSRAEACLVGGGGVGSASIQFAEQRKHLVSHQVHRLCHAPNIDARFETLDAASKNGPHVGPGQNFSLNQMFKERQGGRAVRYRNALSAAAEKIDYGYSSPYRRGDNRAAHTKRSFTQYVGNRAADRA